MYHGKRITTGLVEIEVLVGGRPLYVYRDQDQVFYVAGQPGRPFQVVVTNLTGAVDPAKGVPLEVICSVDGNDVQVPDGADRFLSHGILALPGVPVVFKGFRSDSASSNEFVFGGLDGSVAEQVNAATGSTEPIDDGVIGICVYRGTTPLRTPTYTPALRSSELLKSGPLMPMPLGTDLYRESFAEPAQRTRSASRSPVTDMATHAGNVVDDKIGGSVSFQRTGMPEVTAVYYLTEGALRAAGIWATHRSDPFPGRRPVQPGYGSVIGQPGPLHRHDG